MKIQLVSKKLFRTTNIRKKVTAHIGPPGSLSTTSGYVMNTNPGPEFTTLSIGTP